MFDVLRKNLANAKLMMGIIKTSTLEQGIASEITYTVYLNIPDVGVTEETDIVPAGDRYPDELEITAAKPGTPFVAILIAQRIYCFIDEMPAFGPCDSAAQGNRGGGDGQTLELDGLNGKEIGR